MSQPATTSVPENLSPLPQSSTEDEAQPDERPVPQASGSIRTGYFGEKFVHEETTQFGFEDRGLLSGTLHPCTFVKTADGSMLFKNQKMLIPHQIMHHKDVVLDAAGKPAATLHSRRFTLVRQERNWQIFRGESTSEGDLVADVMYRLIHPAGLRIRVTLPGKHVPELQIKGDAHARNFEFVHFDAVIAECERHGAFHNASRCLTDGEDRFVLTVQPGVDTALLIFVTLIIDDIMGPTH